MRRPLALLLALLALLVSSSAWAINEFRAGSVSYRVPNPAGAPLTAEFTFRATFIAPGSGNGTVYWGDGTQQMVVFGGTIVGSGTEANTGTAWTTREVKVNHTYPSYSSRNVVLLMSQTRDGTLQNGAASIPYLHAFANLGVTGNTGGVTTTQGPYLAFQPGPQSFIIPYTDYEGDPLILCRPPSTAESGLPANGLVPTVPNGGAVPTYTKVPTGCQITWDLTNAVAGQRYSLYVIMETQHLGDTGRDGLELLVEVLAPPCVPVTETCNGLDDNCNQIVDDVPGIGGACVTGLPSVCGAGVSSCSNNQFLCTPNVLPGAVAETCNNVDDDCNGSTDEGNPGGGVACTTAFPGVCAPGTTLCSGGAVLCIGAILPGQQTESCGDAIDGDCDGNLDNNCPDADGDGLFDYEEALVGTDPTDRDTDDDGVSDFLETTPDVDTDHDGLPNGADPDADNDGLFDGTELGLGCAGLGTDASAGHCVADADSGATKTDPLSRDSDGGGASDGAEDLNWNGKLNAGETDPTFGSGADDGPDTDADGLADALETKLGSSLTDTDTDDDGVPDGSEANLAIDADGDGINNLLDPDSDDDGLLDATELGFGCLDPDTDVTRGWCREDLDLGAHVTSPTTVDTDRGGTPDGSEDINLNGVWDIGESNAEYGTAADDAGQDSDGDGLGDALETALGADPDDEDSDDDGWLDTDERNPGGDPDMDGLANVADPDADGDGLFDGTELGFACTDPDTDTSAQQCLADGDDGATTTDPQDPDSDDGGAVDGFEDTDKNGVFNAGETDPNDPSDDLVDSDGDGLFDDEEATLGSDPLDTDTDDDGVLDGAEGAPSEDTDGDTVANILDADSDGDGLHDGTELGLPCDQIDTDPAASSCFADGDAGATTTDPLAADTDGGSVADGTEDANHNGVVDEGETDPNVAADDVPAPGCLSDAECGAEDSGLVCDGDGACVEGCRGTNGNGCAAGLVCTSTTEGIGSCVKGADPITPAPSIDSGCAAAPTSPSESAPPWFVGAVIALGAALAARRRGR